MFLFHLCMNTQAKKSMFDREVLLGMYDLLTPEMMSRSMVTKDPKDFGYVNKYFADNPKEFSTKDYLYYLKNSYARTVEKDNFVVQGMHYISLQRGDGNCFYRSAIVAMLENLIDEVSTEVDRGSDFFIYTLIMSRHCIAEGYCEQEDLAIKVDFLNFLIELIVLSSPYTERLPSQKPWFILDSRNKTIASKVSQIGEVVNLYESKSTEKAKSDIIIAKKISHTVRVFENSTNFKNHSQDIYNKYSYFSDNMRGCVAMLKEVTAQTIEHGANIWQSMPGYVYKPIVEKILSFKEYQMDDAQLCREVREMNREAMDVEISLVLSHLGMPLVTNGVGGNIQCGDPYLSDRNGIFMKDVGHYDLVGYIKSIASIFLMFKELRFHGTSQNEARLSMIITMINTWSLSLSEYFGFILLQDIEDKNTTESMAFDKLQPGEMLLLKRTTKGAEMENNMSLVIRVRLDSKFHVPFVSEFPYELNVDKNYPVMIKFDNGCLAIEHSNGAKVFVIQGKPGFAITEEEPDKKNYNLRITQEEFYQSIEPGLQIFKGKNPDHFLRFEKKKLTRAFMYERSTAWSEYIQESGPLIKSYGLHSDNKQKRNVLSSKFIDTYVAMYNIGQYVIHDIREKIKGFFDAGWDERETLDRKKQPLPEKTPELLALEQELLVFEQEAERQLELEKIKEDNLEKQVFQSENEVVPKLDSPNVEVQYLPPILCEPAVEIKLAELPSHGSLNPEESAKWKKFFDESTGLCAGYTAVMKYLRDNPSAEYAKLLTDLNIPTDIANHHHATLKHWFEKCKSLPQKSAPLQPKTPISHISQFKPSIDSKKVGIVNNEYKNSNFNLKPIAFTSPAPQKKTNNLIKSATIEVKKAAQEFNKLIGLLANIQNSSNNPPMGSIKSIFINNQDYTERYKKCQCIEEFLNSQEIFPNGLTEDLCIICKVASRHPRQVCTCFNNTPGLAQECPGAKLTTTSGVFDGFRDRGEVICTCKLGQLNQFYTSLEESYRVSCACCSF